MSVTLVSSPTLDSNALYKNLPFDIAFSATSSPVVDLSLSYINSTPGLINYISNDRFASSGLSAVGSNATLSVDVLTTTPTSFSNINPELSPPGYAIIATSNYPIILNSCIDLSWSSVGGVLPLYKFEPFTNIFTVKPAAGSGITLTFASNSSTELLGYLSGGGTSNVAFRSLAGANTAYPGVNLLLNIQAKKTDGTLVDEVTSTVTINPGRITLSPSNTNLIFYRNEPSPNPVFSLVASPVQVMYSTTALPAGLSFIKTSANAFTLTGTPTVQSVLSNFNILAQDTANRAYSTLVSMTVNPERVIIDVNGSLSNSGLSSNVPMSPINFTARFPPYAGFRAITYAWSVPPPAGIQFTRTANGSNISAQFAQINSTEDASFGLTLSGTITAAQLESFARNGVTSYPITLTGTRSAGGGALSPSVPKTITLSFAETIFFDSSIGPLIVDVPVSNMYYTAKTYFPTMGSTSVQSISIIDGFIPDGLDASFTPSTQKFSFAGTPVEAGFYAFRLQASNANGTTAEIPVSMTTSNDSLTITSSVTDTCFNFIQYRNLSNDKTGYYPPSINYKVTSTANLPTTLTGSNLPAGVSLTPSVNGGFDLSGMPTSASGLVTATLNARSTVTTATASRTFNYSVTEDSFTFNTPTFAFTQNVPFTPVTIDASTFSEQPIIRFSSPTIPAALQVANTGEVLGTMLGSNSGTFNVTAFTPYSSGTKTYSYTVIPDSVLLEPDVFTTVTAPGCNVSIPINGYSLSAVTVSNYRFSAPFPYGLTVDSTTGVLSGTLSTTLPSNVPFTLLGSVGLVDGTLSGTMVTSNLTVNRAQLLRNDYNAAFFPGRTTLYIYSSDDNGATWTQTHTESNNIYAGSIGTNGSTLYLVPTSSNFLLTSTTGASYTRSDFDVASATPKVSFILNKPGTSTWWMFGTRDRDTGGGRGAFLYTSSNDGVSWSRGSEITTGGFTARDSNEAPSSSQWSPYIVGGGSLAYKDGVLLLGGSRILRSTDEGVTWSTVIGGFTLEVANFSVEQETVWVATGSDGYSTGAIPPGFYNSDANTICYSVDTGLTWTYASNTFNMNGYDLKYGGGAWMACGLTGGVYYTQEVRYSFDAVNWTVLSAVPSPVLETVLKPQSLFELGSLAYDETEWKLITSRDSNNVVLYSHPYDLPIEYGWTATDIGTSFEGLNSQSRFTSYTAQTIDPGADITTISFPEPNTGPTFVSPLQSTFVLWQYMPIPAITFRAVDGGGSIAYFVSPLPVGLKWDPITYSVSGQCIDIGTQTFTVYAKSTTGVTSFLVTVIVNVPRIIRQQSGAGAYTSLLRQYTEVNAAQKARDTRAFPTQVSGIGEFASPYPPDVITPSNCPC